MNELQWVDFLRQKQKPAKDLLFGIGDDCAIINPGKEKLLLKSDLFIQGVHFNLENISFIDIGKRAVARVLSDFAACGGQPKFIGISLAAPKKILDKNLKQILKGVLDSAKEYKFSLIGGDTSKAKSLILDIWAVGACKKAILRNGAKVDDYIFLSGPLGKRPFNRPFEPRLKESRYLVNNFKINSMIDISDGFILDLYRVLKASKKGALINFEGIPVNKGEKDLYRGEDYELIFTVDKNDRKIEALKKKFYCLGKIVPKKQGYKIRKKGKIQEVSFKGYSHF